MKFQLEYKKNLYFKVELVCRDFYFYEQER